MNNKTDKEKYIKIGEEILKKTKTAPVKNIKRKKIRTKFYNRKLVRSILRNRLKTNKINGAFHDKEWLKVYFNTL